MDFLLESQKRNKKWILLRQLLLLLLRTTAIALVVFMLAGPVLQSQWGRFFGKGTTHHLILLDDSFSMSERWGQTTALEEAKKVIGNLLDQATTQPGLQKLSLVKFSEAPSMPGDEGARLIAQDLDRNLYDEIVKELQEYVGSETAIGPLVAIKAALELPEALGDETRIAYLISDFRDRQWNKDSEVSQQLGELRQQVEQLHLIQCVDQTRPNLSITRLEPESGIRGAGVECWMELAVKNFGDQPVANIVARISQDGHRLPGVEFEEIKAGEEVTRRFRVAFSSPGAHQLQASLESDALEADNVRYFACQVPSEFPVLIIDGSREGDDGYYLRTALNPGGGRESGWNPQIESPAYLRKHEELSKYSAIFLLDVSRMDQTEVEALESYVGAGGGLGIFLGPDIQRDFYNEELYRDGAGMLPAMLDVPTQLVSDGELSTPDVVVSDHPLFRIFQGRRNSFLSIVAVNFYYAIDSEWRKPDDGSVKVLAELYNGAPYILEKKFGEGRVLLQLSKLSPKTTALGIWSNWSVNPVFPVYANELVGHLSASQRQTDLKEVGSDLQLRLAEADYEPEVVVHLPQSLESQANTITPQVEDGEYIVNVGRSEVSGVWQFDLQPRDGPAQREMIAVNVETSEGDLHQLNREQLAERLEGIEYDFSLASQMGNEDSSLAGFQLQDTFLYLLLGALIIEQWLAYKASYHSSESR